MKIETIHKLNHLNQVFYQQVAEAFSASRQAPWSGWKQVASLISHQLPTSPILLDVGCGNGRWAEFIASYLTGNPQYIGVDSNSKLLDIAAQHSYPELLKVSWLQIDVITSILDSTFESRLQAPPCDLVTLYGVLHHVPSFELRRRVLATLINRIKSGGWVVFTVWKFLDNPRLKQKIVPFSQVEIDSQDLEPHDYLLDWQRGGVAYRYCHYVSEQELLDLLHELPVKVVTTFTDDAKEGNGNLYIVLQKG